jgi:hypothetical protein
VDLYGKSPRQLAEKWTEVRTSCPQSGQSTRERTLIAAAMFQMEIRYVQNGEFDLKQTSLGVSQFKSTTDRFILGEMRPGNRTRGNFWNWK